MEFQVVIAVSGRYMNRSLSCYEHFLMILPVVCCGANNEYAALYQVRILEVVRVPAHFSISE